MENINNLIDDLIETYTKGGKIVYPTNTQLKELFSDSVDIIIDNYDSVIEITEKRFGDNQKLFFFIEDCISNSILALRDSDLNENFTSSYSSAAMTYEKNNSTESKKSYSEYISSK